MDSQEWWWITSCQQSRETHHFEECSKGKAKVREQKQYRHAISERGGEECARIGWGVILVDSGARKNIKRKEIWEKKEKYWKINKREAQRPQQQKKIKAKAQEPCR